MWQGRWFSPDTPVSSTNKTDRHDIAKILLKVALNTTNLNPNFRIRKVGRYQTLHRKYKDWATRTSLKSVGLFGWFWGVSRSCSTNDTGRVTVEHLFMYFTQSCYSEYNNFLQELSLLQVKRNIIMMNITIHVDSHMPFLLFIQLLFRKLAAHL